MKTFNHIKIDPLPTLERIDGEKRLYETPDGNRYPSVTTVLSNTADKSFLVKWKARIGEEAANKETARAAGRGTSVHNLCEAYVLNKPVDLRREMPLNAALFSGMKRFLDLNVDDITATEATLFSHKLKVAGACDLIARYRGRKAIIDYKTSTKLKRKEWIKDYFLQAAMYSYMYWEMTGIYHPLLVVVIAVEHEPEPQVFDGLVSDYIDEAFERCKRYHSFYS